MTNPEVAAAIWRQILDAAQGGDHPSAIELAEAIVVCGVPSGSAAALYVGNRLTGKIKQPARRPKMRRQIRLIARGTYQLRLRELQRWRESDLTSYKKTFGGHNPPAWEVAQKAVADELGLSVKRLRDILYDAETKAR